MPRGFLVKRSKRVSLVSYRSRCADEGEERNSLARRSTRTCWPTPALALAPPPEREIKAIRFGNPEGAYQALYSPTRPASREEDAERHSGLGLRSPASAEAFPAAAALTALEHLFNMGSSTATSKPERKVKPAAKRVKNIRKLHFDDDVTTSPVLGLKIRAVPAVERQVPGGHDTGAPRGDFVCQLCREAYADPLGLAQHRCSRIIRVEYRCPECDKVFSCPANLASHRRWHKPKMEQKGRPEDAPRDAPSPASSESEGEEPHQCGQCAKKFKRHAYLRKHIAVQHAPIKLSVAARGGTCPTCGEAFASVDARERHFRLLHAFRCKHCPAVLHSSPGLTRHVNRCHPSEDRNVILLHLPLQRGERVVGTSASQF
ncbi:insulinoma-associated protein 1a-like [Phyllopteryx taeniolatus]|uniref:insulinoma-associated protein 1a-like n=1 Tax=Phyllopteryx taeniolatus TaxID=161469 RepID=UPI002AD28A4F|nr:insulinoma-associated protein 1a-like [Phyllopteryx taeniolatus]